MKNVFVKVLLSKVKILENMMNLCKPYIFKWLKEIWMMTYISVFRGSL